MTKARWFLTPVAPGLAPSRLRREAEKPPWPPSPLVWGLSWACQELELEEELRATRTKLRRLRRDVVQAESLGFSPSFQLAARSACNTTAVRVSSLKVDLVWVAAALGCGQPCGKPEGVGLTAPE